jgi:hypothetical protein
MKRLFWQRIWLWVCGGALLCAAPCQAQETFDIELYTQGLIGHPAAPFSLAFQLTDGSGTDDGNNTAQISQFDFGGGDATGSPILVGDASGDLTSTVTLTDSQFLNEFIQPFDPGSTLLFQVSLTGNVDAGPTPDEFAVKILDCMDIEIPTNGLGDSLVIVDISSPAPPVQTYVSDPNLAPACGGNPIDPQVIASVVPEPDGCVQVGLLLGGLLVQPCLRRKRAPVSANH